MHGRRHFLTTTILAALALMLIPCQLMAAPDEYPTRPVEGVIPWAPGGGTDTLSRAFAPLLEKRLGQPIVIQNKKGASGALGTNYVLSKPADGYTLLFSAETPGVFRVMGLSDNSFNDLEPIIMLATMTPTVTVKGDAPWKNVDELIAYAKANPGKLKAGYSGPGTTGHIGMLLFAEAAGVKLQGIPFDGGGKVSVALMGGHIDVIFNILSTVIEPSQAGKFKILATFTLERIKDLPDIPAIVETQPAFNKYLPWGSFYSLQVKKGTPDFIVEKLKQAAAKVIEEPEWLAFLKTVYGLDTGLQGEVLQKYIRDWESHAAWLLHNAGATINSPEKFDIPKP